MNKPSDWITQFPWPKRNGHKYDRGSVMVAGGPMEKAGAAKLAALAALRTGAGLVSILSAPEDCLAYAASAMSVMTLLRDKQKSALQDERIGTWVIGPGAGVTLQTMDDVLAVLAVSKKLVLDADGITVFEKEPQRLFSSVQSDCICTPHEGEFKRLFPALANKERNVAAQEAAKLSGCVIIYKGPETVIAAPDGMLSINKNAPAELATAGSGDVLSGICAGLLSQGMEAYAAACAAVWLHSEAAAMFGPGLISEDIITMLPKALQRLKK